MSISERETALDELCQGDSELQREVEGLLGHFDAAGMSFPGRAFGSSSPIMPSLEHGDRLGHYEIQEMIGEGGVGVVYRARDPRLQRTVAVKVLHPGSSPDRQRVQRFQREARAASALNHPNICTVHDIGEHEEHPFLVLEYLEGETLQARLNARSMNLETLLGLARQIASGLAAAHRAGIVHRDLKPANVFVTDGGLVKILDFGLAKSTVPDDRSLGSLTAFGLVAGTPLYMSPEQARGSRIDARTDVFSMGVILFEMATGKRPVEESTAAAFYDALLNHPPRSVTDLNPSVPEPLAHIIARCLEKEPGRRYPSATELLHELDAVSASADRTPDGLRMNVLAGRDRPPMTDVTRHAGRWRRPLVVVGLAAVLVAAGIWTVRTTRHQPAATAEVVTEQEIALPAEKLAVAVIPATSRTNDPRFEDIELERVLGDMMMHILSEVDGLYVISPWRLENVARELGRTWSEARDDLDFALEVGKRSQANAVLSVDFSNLGRTHTLAATMTRVGGGEHLGTFRADSEDPDFSLPELSDEMQSAIGERFGGVTSPASPSGTVATRSVTAYAHYIRGISLIDEGRWNEAVTELEKATEIDPEMGVAWSEMGCAYSFAGDQAMAEASQWEAEKWTDEMTRKERLWVESNGVWLRTYNGDLYREKIQQFIDEFPDERNGYLYAGLCAQWLDGDYSKALEWYERAYLLTPFYYPITKSLVECYVATDQTDRAIATLQRYLRQPRVPDYGRQQAEAQLEDIRPTP